MTIPELKPAGEWSREWIRRPTSFRDIAKEIQDDAIRWAADTINDLSNQDSPRLGLREKLLKRWEEIR
jgi:hypothetical protein